MDSLLDTADGSSLFDKMPEQGSGAAVYLMRHGRTPMDMGSNRSDGWLDMPLTDEGRMHLIDAQQMLKAVPLVKIYVPDLKRTIETGELIKSGTTSDPELIESRAARTWKLGEIAGMKKSEGRPKVKDLKLNPTRAPPGGESYSEFKARFLAWLHPLMNKASEKKPILLVLSGSNLRLIGLEFFDSEDACDLGEGGLAALHKDGGQWSCEALLEHEDAVPYES